MRTEPPKDVKTTEENTDEFMRKVALIVSFVSTFFFFFKIVFF